jgi:hypothetical protein
MGAVLSYKLYRPFNGVRVNLLACEVLQVEGAAVHLEGTPLWCDREWISNLQFETHWATPLHPRWWMEDQESDNTFAERFRCSREVTRRYKNFYYCCTFCEFALTIHLVFQDCLLEGDPTNSRLVPQNVHAWVLQTTRQSRLAYHGENMQSHTQRTTLACCETLLSPSVQKSTNCTRGSA